MVTITAIPALAARLASIDKEIDRVAMANEVESLKAQIAAIKAGGKEKKNHKVGKASPTRTYTLLSRDLKQFGRVPQQQQDLARVLVKDMVVGESYTEQQVFDILIDGCGEYESLYKSEQDVTYLFRYYRGLKNDGKHAGFVARDFIRVIG